jgi:hypothetical protein
VSGTQQVVAAGGIGLLLVNFWTGPDRATISGGLFNSGATAAQTTAAHKELVKFGGALIFVGVASLLAGVSRSWGASLVAVMLGLWILWAMHHFGGAGAKPSTGSTPTTKTA